MRLLLLASRSGPVASFDPQAVRCHEKALAREGAQLTAPRIEANAYHFPYLTARCERASRPVSANARPATRLLNAGDLPGAERVLERAFEAFENSNLDPSGECCVVLWVAPLPPRAPGPPSAACAARPAIVTVRGDRIPRAGLQHGVSRAVQVDVDFQARDPIRG